MRTSVTEAVSNHAAAAGVRLSAACSTMLTMAAPPAAMAIVIGRCA
jgi:hypothetical protein